MLKNVLLVLIISGLLVSCISKKKGEGKNARWYSESQVLAGKKVYESNCISCHNEDGIGSFNWQKKLQDGTYPPPPLDGDGHTWHHSFKSLKNTIRQGGVNSGGTMPPFAKVLSNEEIENVLAYAQNKWDDRVYESWMRISGIKK